MTESDFLQILRELGGIGIAGYLVYWLTRKLNGKFDRLTTSVEKLNDSIESLVREQRR